jgi:putative heme iron utilization protein
MTDTMDLKQALAVIESYSPAGAAAFKVYLTGDENRTELQRYRVSKAEQVRIQRAAQAAGVTASEFVRAAVLAKLDNGEGL